MARKMKRAAKGKRARPRVSRSLIEQMLVDLCKRIEEQVEIAEAIAKVSKPNCETIMGAWPMLKVINLAATRHDQDLRQARDFARLISDRVAS